MTTNNTHRIDSFNKISKERKEQMELRNENGISHFMTVNRQISIQSHFIVDKANGNFSSCWQEKRLQDNQEDNPEWSEIWNQGIFHSERANKKKGTILNYNPNPAYLNQKLTNLTLSPQRIKGKEHFAHSNIVAQPQPISLHQTSSFKQSTETTSKTKSEYHYTPIAPYRRLPLSYRRSAKNITKKSDRDIKNNRSISQFTLQARIKSASPSHSELCDFQHTIELEKGRNRIENMSGLNPLCLNLAHVPRIEDVEEATSPPSTPGTSSVRSGRRSSAAMSSHNEPYRSLKGKKNMKKASSAWDEEEKQRKSPSKSVSKWMNFGASNRVEKKKAKNFTTNPSFALNRSKSNIDLASHDPLCSPKHISMKQNDALYKPEIRAAANITPLPLRTSEPNLFFNSFGNTVSHDKSAQSFTNPLMKNIKPSLRAQSKYLEESKGSRIPQRAYSLQESIQTGNQARWSYATSPESPHSPTSLSNTYKFNSLTGDQAHIFSEDSSIGGDSTIQSPPSPTQEILWDSKRKLRCQTRSTFSPVPQPANQRVRDPISSTKNALFQGLQSPIDSFEVSTIQPINPKRVSKNIGVQNIRETAKKLQKALNESEEVEDQTIDGSRKVQRSVNIHMFPLISNQSSHHLSMSASVQSLNPVPSSPVNSNARLDTTNQSQGDTDQSSIKSTPEQAPNDRSREREKLFTNIHHGEDLEACNKFLTELQADLGPPNEQDEADDTITAADQGSTLSKPRRKRSSTSHREQLFRSERAQVTVPRRSCASFTLGQVVATNSKTSLSSHSDPEEIGTNEFEQSQGYTSETGSSNFDSFHYKDSYQDAEAEDSYRLHEEEVLQSSNDTSESFATTDQTADAHLEILDCQIQSVKRFDITTTVPPSPRVLRPDSQHSFLSQTKSIKKESVDEKRNSSSSILHPNVNKTNETLHDEVIESQSLTCKDCQIQSVEVKIGEQEKKMDVILNWKSKIDLTKFQEVNRSQSSSKANSVQMIHGTLRLADSEVERIARAWIDKNLGQSLPQPHLFSSSEALRRASEQLSVGLTEDELRKVNKSVLEQRQREILASSYASAKHSRDQMREKMANIRVQRDRKISTTSSDDSCKSKRRSLYLKPDQFPSPGLYIDTEGASVTDSFRSKSLSNSPNRFHPLISPVSASDSARQSFNSIASFKRFSPKK